MIDIMRNGVMDILTTLDRTTMPMNASKICRSIGRHYSDQQVRKLLPVLTDHGLIASTAYAVNCNTVYSITDKGRQLIAILGGE